MDVSFHVKKLDRACRIFGHPIEIRSYAKSLFKEELKELFKIDIDNDVDEIHPPNICKNHARLIYCYREYGKFSQEEDATYLFLPHSIDYDFCKHGKSGRKTKMPKSNPATDTQATGSSKIATGSSKIS